MQGRTATCRMQALQDNLLPGDGRRRAVLEDGRGREVGVVTYTLRLLQKPCSQVAPHIQNTIKVSQPQCSIVQPLQTKGIRRQSYSWLEDELRCLTCTPKSIAGWLDEAASTVACVQLGPLSCAICSADIINEWEMHLCRKNLCQTAVPGRPEGHHHQRGPVTLCGCRRSPAPSPARTAVSAHPGASALVCMLGELQYQSLYPKYKLMHKMPLRRKPLPSW